MKKLALFLVLVLVTLCFYTPSSVEASQFMVQNSIKDPYTKHENWGSITIYGCKKGTEIKHLKISNKKVIKFDKKYGVNHTPVYQTEDGTECSIGYYAKRVGKTYVTGDIYYNGSKVKSFKTKITLYNYKSPFKKIKFGKKNLIKKFKKARFHYFKAKKNKKYKLSYKLKKGFKVKSIELWYGAKEKKIKNNHNVVIPKGYDFPALMITIKNKKQKTTEGYCLEFYKY